MRTRVIKHFRALTQRTGHYFVKSDDGAEASRRWIALHGYGQKADHLIRKFDVLDSKEHLIVAPEGLSRFYWEGVNGDVTASWMTKGDRLDEIADYISWLDKVNELTRYKSMPTTLFGFSQGCATAWRWLLNSEPDIDSYIMWSGWLPEDLFYPAHQDYLKSIRLIYVHGVNDPYYKPNRFDVLQSRFREAGIVPEVIRHPGGHLIDREILFNIAGQL